MIRCLQGETLKVEISVVDGAGDPKDLTGADAQMAYKKAGEDAVEKSCSIASSQVSVLFSAADTAVMSGQYSLEIKVKDSSGYVDAVYQETLSVEPSLIPSY